MLFYKILHILLIRVYNNSIYRQTRSNPATQSYRVHIVGQPVALFFLIGAASDASIFCLSGSMKKKKQFRIGITIKAVIMIVLFTAAISISSIVYTTNAENRANEETYKVHANDLAKTVSEVIDIDDFKYLKDQVKTIVDASPKKPTSEEWGSPDWNEYMAQFDHIQEDPIFIKTREYLRKIYNANKSSDVDCFYLSYLDIENQLLVYVVDTAPIEDACPPGCLDPIYEVNKPVLDDPTRGFPAYITNTEEYGWLVTSGSPVYSGEEIVGYSFVDISMEVIRGKVKERILYLSLNILLTFLVISVIGIIFVHFVLSRPIKQLRNVANSYDSSDSEKNHQAFLKLRINTHDEIQDLSEAMIKMENDVYTHTNQLVHMNKQLVLSQKQTKKMKDLANRDGLTGVQNKFAYNSEVEKINEAIAKGKAEPFAIVMIDLNYLKYTNDEFGHDAGDIALIKLAKIVCDIFAHSPVYRIGGDEFVILLRKNDYDNRERLIKTFNVTIEHISHDNKLPEEERISAAIGCSTYNKSEDESVDDVFKRADKAMYEKKHQMKEHENR